MKKNLRDSFKEIDEFFKSPLTANQKAWGIIHDFIHVIMTKMDEISQTDLIDRLAEEMIEGYRSMAHENLKMLKEFEHVDREIW